MLSQGYKIINFFPVRIEFKFITLEPQPEINEFGDNESEYGEDYIAADYHYDDGGEDTEYPPSDVDSTEELYQREAALAEKKIEKEKKFQEWRISHVFNNSGAIPGLNNYLQYFAIAKVQK